MNIQKVTVMFILVIIAAIVLYDGYALIVGGTEASISFRLISWSYQHPVLPFTIGFCMGHLFWRMSDKNNKIGKE